MRFVRRGWLLAGAAILVGWLFGSDVLRTVAPSFIKSREDSGVYFRLLAKYQHGDEAIEFNIVAGCAVRVTRYGDGGSSYDASLDPPVYARTTKDGGAVWQIVPFACLGETTANGKVPNDLLPGAIWFDSAHDFSFGTAYVTEDAFENPKSKLKFLGATILKATRNEWEAFQPTAAENLVSPKQFGSVVYHPTQEEIAANLWNREALLAWRPTAKCHLVQRFEISDEAAIAAIRERRPASQPKFWTLPDAELQELEATVFPRHGVEIREFPSSDYYRFGQHPGKAYPTRARGGMLHSDGSVASLLPSEIYPIKMGDGIPWLAPALAEADAIYTEVDLDHGANRGFAYCYTTLRYPDPIRDAHLSEYHKRNFATKVDGTPVFGELQADPHYVDGPRIFFEEDNAYYIRGEFGL